MDKFLNLLFSYIIFLLIMVLLGNAFLAFLPVGSLFVALFIAFWAGVKIFEALEFPDYFECKTEISEDKLREIGESLKNRGKK